MREDHAFTEFGATVSVEEGVEEGNFVSCICKIVKSWNRVCLIHVLHHLDAWLDHVGESQNLWHQFNVRAMCLIVIDLVFTSFLV